MTTAIAQYEKPTDLPALTQFTTMANAITVVDADTREFAADQYRDVKAQRDAIEKRRVERKAPALQICNDVDGDHQPIIKAADAYLTIVKGKIASFDAAERKRIADEQYEAERQRRAAEAVAEAAAAKLVKAGAIDEAEAVREAAAVAPRAVVAVAPKSSGDYTRKVWSGRVTDVSKFLTFLAANAELAGMIVEFKQSALNKLAEKSADMPIVPGFEGGLVDSLTLK